MESTAKDCHTSNIHCLLNPSQPTERAFQQQSECISNHKQATAQHAASSNQDNAKAQQYPPTIRDTNARELRPTQSSSISASSIKPKMSSTGPMPLAYPQNTSQSLSSHNNNLSTAAYRGIAVSQQYSTIHQPPIYPGSLPASSAPLALSGYTNSGSLAQYSHPIPTAMDMVSGSKASAQKRRRNKDASARFRESRKKDIQRIRELTVDCERYRRERDHYYNELHVIKSRMNIKTKGL